MKLTRKLIPALAMLLVSAVLMSTASFAWFSMSKTVTATGMEVTAKSDAIFLLISGANDGGAFTETGTANVSATLFPVAHGTWSSKADIEDFDIGDTGASNNWYFGYSAAANDHTLIDSTKKFIDEDKFDDYVLSTTYQVKLDDSMATTAYDLYVSSVTIPDDSGIAIVIVGENGYKEFKASTTIAEGDYEDGLISNVVTDTAQTITVYIYIDGNNTNVTNDTIDALTGEVTFQLSAFPQDHT